MKNLLLTLGIGSLMTFGVVSCTNSAGSFSGAWSGRPEKIAYPSEGIEVVMSPTMTLTPGENNGGTVLFSGLLSGSQPVSPDPSGADVNIDSIPVLDPYEISIAGTYSVSGTYSFKNSEREEMLIDLDYSTLEVKVDPEAVTYTNNQITETQQPVVQQLNEKAVLVWKNSMTRALSSYFTDFSLLDDVKVKDGVMSFEVKDKDYIYTAVKK
ncbi:MAG: hypothetical protein K2M79_00830 [Muribaculaceae bacterium]|nr:hypothetical protein [Muribaculaceae bacterium]